MGSEFPSQPLGRLVENLDSRRVPLSSRERAKRQGTFPYYGATGVMDYVDDYLFEGLHLLVAEDGSVERPDGRPFLQLVSGRFWVNNHAHVLRGSTPVDTRFLYYALNTVAIRPFVSGSVQAKLSQRNMNTIPVPFPRDPAERERIVEILGTLDDKIELNRRMNETLEGMARALFKSWFVDFDPVRAKMEGRWQPGESLPGLPADLYDLFPDRLVESELGEVPEGWEVGPLREFASMTRNSVNPQQHPDEVFAHYSIPAFDDGRTPVLEAGEAIKSNKYLVGPHSILVSKLNPRIPRVWLPAAADGPRGICSTEFLVTESADLGHRSWLYCLLTSEAFQTRFRTLVTGTSGSHQRVRPQAYMALPIVAPPKELRSLFAETADALLSRSQAGRHESESLVALRSTLLPKLISGELRLPEAEQFVEQAT